MVGRYWLAALTGAGILFGAVLVYLSPSAPLLAYWLLLGTTVGLIMALLPSLGGIERRLRWIVWTFALLIFASLITTQMAARRAISSTHLLYSGVHLVGVDSFTIGSGAGDTEVRLQTLSSSQRPWSMGVRRGPEGWELEPLYGIEQLRVRHGSTRPIGSAFAVARSAALRPGDAVTVVGPDDEVADTIRVVSDGIETSSGSRLSFDASSRELSARAGRYMFYGTALANLEGDRSAGSTVYERFVRVQEIDADAEVNGEAIPLALRLLPGSRRYLISATPPYTLRGDAVSDDRLTVADSAFVEVRNGDAVWRFGLQTDWRREPGAQRGVAILFNRNPKPMDTPLPVGISCQPGAACGAISLRRLPPPIAHVALDNAGFDPEQFGLLGTLRVADDGYDVVLPRAVFRVERGRPRPMAVPVTPLEQDTANAAAGNNGESRWVLLAAAGERDNMLKVLLIGAGLALLLGGIHSAVRTVTIRGATRLTLTEERAIAAGIVALLGLMLTRVTVGARVAFFDPFLARGIETAVGLCVAIAVVIVGLLSWSAWLPSFMAGARSALSGHSSPVRVMSGAVRWSRRLGAESSKEHGLRTFAFLAPALLLLTLITGGAPWQGLFTGVVVLLVWVCVAWVVAFTGQHFDTFERGAHSVIEQLSPPRPARAAAATGSAINRLLARVPELHIIVAAVALMIAHMLPRVGLLAAAVVLAVALVVVWRRRVGGYSATQPDYAAAAVGVAVFGACIAALRLASQNGSIGAFVLVVFVALASVRIGRSVGARLEARTPRTDTPAMDWLVEACLLATPLFLLLPLAGIDMGLVLVLVLPLGFATLLATGIRAPDRRLIVLTAAMLLVALLGWKVMFPSLQPIRNADSHVAQADAFADMSSLSGMRLPLLSTPLDRAAARSVATHDRALAEALLVAAGPGSARDLLVPSIEQIWGTKAYASSGVWGEGLGQAVIGGRGVAETVSYAENTFSVFVLAEHGAVGGVLVLLLYGMLALAVAVLILERPGGTSSYRASRSLFLVAALIIVFPACYVALSNVGVVPITGQNMPFLGLNAWSDVAVCAGVIGILITGALRGLEEAGR